MTSSTPASALASNTGQDQGQAQGQQDPLQPLRQLAEQVLALSKQIPEGTESAAEILKSIQKWMARAAGNPNRTPDRQAAPVGV